MRLSIRLSSVLLVVLLAAAPVCAGGAPNYSAESLIFIQSDLPEGWTLVDPEDELPAGLPTEAALTDCAGDAVDAFELALEYRLLQHTSGAKAVVAIVDVDTEDGPDAYRSALKQHAATSGWTLTDLADPTRVLVVAGQPDHVQVLTSWQTEIAARKLTEMAYYRILSDHAHGKPGPTSQERADEFSTAAEKLLPGFKDVFVIRGLLRLYRDELSDGLAMLEKGTRGGGELAAYPGLVAFALTMQGRYMTEAKKSDLDSDAEKVYARAIAMQQVYMDEAKKLNTNTFRTLAFENHYNLACVYVRLDKKDDAYKETREAFGLAKLIFPENTYLGQFRHFWFWDDDFEPLRADGERWEKLCQEIAPKDFDWVKERETAEKAKKARAKNQPKPTGGGHGTPGG